jgi:hypothetical protein
MKKTVGAIASDLLQNAPKDLSPIEIQQAQEKEYLDNLTWCVQHALKKVDCSTVEGHDICKDREALSGDFFVVALLKKERILENVLRNYFIATKACPTPHFDQTVYRYDHQKQDVEFVWVVPDQETCEIFKENAKIIVPAERGLLKYVLDYYDGTLYRTMKKLNGEAMHVGVELENK